MSLKTFLFVVTNCLCIFSCYSLPFKPLNVSFAKFVLDGKHDCGLVNNDNNVILMFNTVSCPTEVKEFSSNYFDQRSVLPCFGAYDALYNLCLFPLKKINFTIPESFLDSKKLCTEAKVVYDQRPFNYTNDHVKKWGESLLATMTNETLCNNLCVLNNEVNKVCIAMLTFANEYMHLKDLSESNLKSANPVVNEQSNDQATLIKTTSQVNRSADTQLNDTVKTNNMDKKTNGNDSLISGPGDLSTQPEKSADPAIETVVNQNSKVNQNSQGDLKPNPIDQSAQQIPTVESHNAEGKLPETETLKKESKISNIDKTANAPPITGIANTPKMSPSVTDENKYDDNDKAITDIEDNHVENEEAMPVETREKGETDEENEKPNEEEKNTVPDTEHAAYHAPSFNAMNDNFSESEDSYSFTYIVTTMAALCCVYLLFHYRNKLLALALEGRKGRGSRGRGRPSSANYSKLHSNLEEAIASNVTTPSATHVLY